MKFCSACGTAVSHRVPQGDSMVRAICDACGIVHYSNPRMVVGCLATWGDRILLCRRAIEPRHGLWTLPAGYLENNETASAGAAREALEEANARVEIEDLYTVYSVPRISQVYVMFRGRLLDPDVSPGTESLEVKLADEREIPWDHLAFPIVRRSLEHFLDDRRKGLYIPRFGEV